MHNDLLQLSSALLAILLAYFAADSVLQFNRQAFNGKTPFVRSLIYGLIHFGFLLLSLAIFDRAALEPSGRQLWIIGYLVVAALIDYGQIKIAAAYEGQDVLWLYLGAQILHVCTVLILVLLLIGISSPTIATIVDFFDSIGNKALSALTIYVGTVFAGGFLIPQLTRPLADHIRRSEVAKGGLPNAGMYIGWLERFLIVTAVLMQSPPTVGLILAGKSIARFPEMKDPRFAEYFLIGTLLSVTIAIAGGMLIQLIWNGTVQFK